MARRPCLGSSCCMTLLEELCAVTAAGEEKSAYACMMFWQYVTGDRWHSEFEMGTTTGCSGRHTSTTSLRMSNYLLSPAKKQTLWHYLVGRSRGCVARGAAMFLLISHAPSEDFPCRGHGNQLPGTFDPSPRGSSPSRRQRSPEWYMVPFSIPSGRTWEENFRVADC